MNRARRFLDFRGICLMAAFAAAALTFLVPKLTLERPVFTHIVVVDITRSMNVEDYQIAGKAISRLDFVKRALTRAVADLPCGSRVGLGIFTERRSTLLFEPIEVCQGFNEIQQSLQHLDWRMAWAADSRIAKGLADALEMTETSPGNLIFLTDGHEAPPVNPRYAVSFEGFKGKVQGMIVGVGGPTPAPIPKFDAEGRRIGFYTAEDVPHRSTFGLPNRDPSEIEGYNARNAPFGSQAVTGTEHLSALHEAYLKNIATESGLHYHRLVTEAAFSAALKAPNLAEVSPVSTDISRFPAIFALLVLGILYVAAPLIAGRAKV